MAALVQAIDSYTPRQFGENGHIENSWSHELREKLVQISFQMTRSHSARIDELSGILRTWLMNIKGLEKEYFLELIEVAYKMIAHTRDIIDGKGEYALAYMQILVWNEFYPELAKFMLQHFVQGEDGGHPYGSWKDIKYFCTYARDKQLPIESPLMQFAFKLVIDRLKEDMSSSVSSKSLVAKWVPREKSPKFGWIFEELATQFFYQFIETARSPAQLTAAKKKCRMEFRKIL
jgi:hypothetical protein